MLWRGRVEFGKRFSVGAFVNANIKRPRTTIRRTMRKLASPDTVLFVTSCRRFGRATSHLGRLFPGAPYVKAVKAELMGKRIGSSNLTILKFFSSIGVHYNVVARTDHYPITNAARLLGRVTRVSPNASSAMYIRCYANSRRGLMAAFASYLRAGNVRLTKNAIFNIPSNGPPIITCGKRLCRSTYICTLVGGAAKGVHMCGRGVCRGASTRDRFTAGISISHGTLVRLSNEPTTSMCDTRLNVPHSGVISGMLIGPVKHTINGRIFVSSVGKVSASNALAGCGQVGGGSYVCFLDLNSCGTARRRAHRRVRRSTSRVSLILSVSYVCQCLLCRGRKCFSACTGSVTSLKPRLNVINNNRRCGGRRMGRAVIYIMFR